MSCARSPCNDSRRICAAAPRWQTCPLGVSAPATWSPTSPAPARAVLDASGFHYRSHLAWVKARLGPGIWLRQRHELLLIATKGTVAPPEPQDRCDSVLEAKRGRHAQKPEQAYQRIEQMYPDKSKLEMFARGTPRAGWSAWGN